MLMLMVIIIAVMRIVMNVAIIMVMTLPLLIIIIMTMMVTTTIMMLMIMMSDDDSKKKKQKKLFFGKVVSWRGEYFCLVLFLMYVQDCFVSIIKYWKYVIAALCCWCDAYDSLLGWTLNAPKPVSHIWMSSFVNSSPPSATYMHQWTGSALVQVMACRLFSAKPLPKHYKLQWNLNQNSSIFIQENAFENVICKMAAILSRGGELTLHYGNDEDL